MKTKTLMLAIFGLLALANAGEKVPNKEALRPTKAYADPKAEQPAYAYPGYQQPTTKRLAKRAAHKLADDINKKFAKAQIDTDPDPPADKAYAHPGYEQPAYKRLAKRDAVAHAYPNNDILFTANPRRQRHHAAYPEYRNGPTADDNDAHCAHPNCPKIQRLAKRDAVFPPAAYISAIDPPPEVPGVSKDAPGSTTAKRLAKRAAPVKKTNDYDYDIYDMIYPGYQINGPTAERLAKRAAPVKKTNDYDYDHEYPGYQIDGPTAVRLAKRDAAAYAAKIQKKIQDCRS